MSTTEYVIWFVLQALAIAAIMVVGTFGASGAFGPDERAARAARRAARTGHHRAVAEPARRHRLLHALVPHHH